MTNKYHRLVTDDRKSDTTNLRNALAAMERVLDRLEHDRNGFNVPSHVALDRLRRSCGFAASLLRMHDDAKNRTLAA